MEITDLTDEGSEREQQQLAIKKRSVKLSDWIGEVDHLQEVNRKSEQLSAEDFEAIVTSH